MTEIPTREGKKPLLLEGGFCMLLAEGALEVVHDFDPFLANALDQLSKQDRYNDLCIKLSNQFKEDYLRSIEYDAENPRG